MNIDSNFSLLIFFVIASTYFFISYQAIIHGRTYWMWPTVAGFKHRKNADPSKKVAIFIGITSLCIGIIFFLLFLRVLLMFSGVPPEQ